MAAPVGNRFSPGRTPMYSDPEDLAQKIEDYFTYCDGEFHIETKTRKIKDEEGNPDIEQFEVKVWDRDPERPKWTGLAMFLGFESRQSLTDYSKKGSFSYPIKRALLLIEQGYEDSLFMQGPTGAIFALKNLGWTDKQQLEHTGEDGGPIQTSTDMRTWIVQDHSGGRKKRQPDEE